MKFKIKKNCGTIIFILLITCKLFSMYYVDNQPMSSFPNESPQAPSGGNGQGGDSSGGGEGAGDSSGGVEGGGDASSESGSQGSSESSTAKQEFIDAVKAEDACSYVLKDLKKQIDAQAGRLEALEILPFMPIDVVNHHTAERNAIMESYNENCARYEQLQTEYARLTEQRIEKANSYKSSLEIANQMYNEQEAAASLGIRGDPVIMTLGAYYCEVDDYIAEDFNDVFKCSRVWLNNNSVGSFGKNWISSLDSRIVRFKLGDKYQEEINIIEEMINLADSALKEIETYNEENPKYPKFSEEKKEWESKKSEYELLKESYLLYQQTNSYIDELNKYVTYGYYSNPQNYKGWYSYIVYVDENALEHVCAYNGDGKWIPIKESFSKEFYILGLDDKHENNKTFNYDGGFNVIYKNGKKLVYNKYGQIIKKIDNNQNLIEYTYNNGLLTSIKNKTGEVFNIKRNKNSCISEISGDVSGKALFYYNGDYLTGVMNNEGIFLTYQYSPKGDLIRINKADNTFVEIDYEYNGELKTDVVSCVTDERGAKEFFEYDFKNKFVYFISTDGQRDIIKLDDNNFVDYIVDSHNKKREVVVNEEGILKDVVIEGRGKSFYYDENNNLYGKNNVRYNQAGLIEYYEDADNFTNEYFYDSKGNLIKYLFCGNLISEYSYYENGLVKSLKEKDFIYSYKYNSFGSLIEKILKEASTGKEVKKETWSYDKNNRLVKYSNSFGEKIEYTYEGRIESQVFNDEKKKILKKDLRNRVIQVIEEDLKSQIRYQIDYEYDGRGNITKVKKDGNDFLEYKYNNSQKIISGIIWGLKADASNCILGIKNEFQYDNKGRIVCESRCKVKKVLGQDNIEELERLKLYDIDYSEKNNCLYIEKKLAADIKEKYVYSNDGKLKEVTFFDGSYEKREYSKAGRLKNIISSDKENISFVYNKDGSTLVYIGDGSQKAELLYDSENKLLSLIDFNGAEFNCEYDKWGNLIREEKEFFYCLYNYDEKNRLVSHFVYANDNKLLYSFFREYEGDSVIEREGGLYKTVKKYDCWNRLVYFEDKNGPVYYEYDANGLCVKEKFLDNVILRDYTPDCMISKIQYGDLSEKIFEYSLTGKVESILLNGRKIISSEYDSMGNPIKLVDSSGNISKYTYNNKQEIVSSEKYNSGKSSFSYPDSKSVFFTDVNGNSYYFEKDKNQNLLREVFPNNRESLYKYDEMNRLIWKKDFEDNEYTFTHYDDGFVQLCNNEKFLVKKDELGRIIEVNSNGDIVRYEYNQAGKLIRQEDVSSSLEVFYYYDEYGRCNRKKSNLSDFEYEYYHTGKVKCVKDNIHNTYVNFEYDIHGNEIKRSYSNGIDMFFGYNSQNMLECVYAKEIYGALIYAEVVLFDENNKISYVADKNGNLTYFEYDEKGRLSSAEYAYTSGFSDFYKNEYKECGGYLLSEEIPLESKSIEKSVKNAFLSIFEKYNLGISLCDYQEVWSEEYTYTKTGSVQQVKNPYGLIIYEYDCMNRLVQKHVENTESKGTKYKWNDNGQLISISNDFNETTFVYGSQNRPILISYNDYLSNSFLETTYTYDVFGRRVTEESSSGDKLKYFYDGLSLEVLISTPLYKNGRAFGVYGGIDVNNDNSMEYRWFDEEINYEKNSYRTKENTFISDVSNGKVSSNLYVNGEKIAFFESSYNKSEKSTANFVHSGLLGLATRAVTSQNGDCINVSKYDAWGSLIFDSSDDFDGYRGYSQDKRDDKNVGAFSNSVNTLLTGELFYDIGYRDYSPEMKSFTTIDRVKDGENWFAYCSCDSVNFIDSYGYEKNSLTESQKREYEIAVTGFGTFNREDYNSQNENSQVPYSFDCADVSSYIDYYATEACGGRTTSEMANNFKDEVDAGNYENARHQVQSRDFIDNNSMNVRKTSNGKEGLTNPDIVTPGTVFVWKNENNDSSWVGHTLTVIAAEVNADGEVCGIVFMEGHTGGERTELGYATVGNNYEANIYNLDAWQGTFEGTFEIESAVNVSTESGNDVSAGCSN